MRPASSISSSTAAISSSASVSALKPPVSTSTTTGRKPRKRLAIGAGSLCAFVFPMRSGDGPAGPIGQIQQQAEGVADAEAGDLRGRMAQPALVAGGTEVDVDPGTVPGHEFA